MPSGGLWRPCGGTSAPIWGVGGVRIGLEGQIWPLFDPGGGSGGRIWARRGARPKKVKIMKKHENHEKTRISVGAEKGQKRPRFGVPEKAESGIFFEKVKKTPFFWGFLG